MSNFILLIDELIKFSKKDIDTGNTPPNVYHICVSIKETFCISYNIRKNHTLYLYLMKNNLIIKLQGKRLRFLGSDERSQALLLLKAIKKGNSIPFENQDQWLKSTPGIYARRFNSDYSFIHLLRDLTQHKLVILFKKISKFDLPFLAHTYDFPKITKHRKINYSEENTYLFPFRADNKNLLIDLLKQIAETYTEFLEDIKLISLSKIKSTEDKILYCNFQMDLSST